MSISSKFTYNGSLSTGSNAFDSTLYDNVTQFSSVLVTCYSTTALTLSLSHSNDKITTLSTDIDTVFASQLYSENFIIKNKFLNINLQNNSGSTATVNLHVKYLTQLGEINCSINYPLINTFNSILSLTDISSNGMDSSGVAITNTVNYDISSNATFFIIKAVGGGGGGGHTYSTGQRGSGGGGGGGGYIELYLTKDDFKHYNRISVTIGKGGTRGHFNSTTVSNGGTGGDTIISLTNTANNDMTKVIATCNGGTGGIGGDKTTTTGGFGGYGGTYSIDSSIYGFGINGNNGAPGWKNSASDTNPIGGSGASSVLGRGGRGITSSATTVKFSFGEYGGGGTGGVYDTNLNTILAGGGGGGRCIIMMFA